MLPSSAYMPNTDPMTTAERTTIFDDLASEITQHYYRGRILIAIDGVDGQATGQFADSLAAAMRTGSRSVVRSTSTPDPAAERHDLSFPRSNDYFADQDHSCLRGIVSRFREGNQDTDATVAVVPPDAMLIVDGRFLLRPELRAIWHFTVWLEGNVRLTDDSLEAQSRYTRDSAPRDTAHAIFNITKAEAPVRVWADSC